jgi:hypothetical protein
MRSEILLALISKLIDERLQEIPTLRGPKGRDGRDGKDAEPVQAFSIETHAEKIREWIREESLKFDDLNDNQIALLKGSPGRDGKGFIFSENEAAITEIILSEIDRMSPDLKLKFSDLSPAEISELRGPEGKQGKAGKDFSFEEHREFFDSLKLRFSDLTENEISELKLKFSDLTEDEIAQLRGPRGFRGQVGKSGKDFVLEEHLDFFQGLKLKFSDLNEEEVNAIKLKFADLTDSDKEQLKLRFEHLTEEERLSLKGPRGQRGKHGPTGEQGIQGPKGEDGKSIRGARGPIGLTGERGYPGLTGRDGVNGKDGEDAPAIVDIDVARQGEEIYFTFRFDDGTSIVTPGVKLQSGGSYYFGGNGGGGSGSGTPGADGLSAYEIWLQEGNVGTEQDFLDSLVGPTGPQGPAGATGAQGPQGDPGPTGAAGADGADGDDGSQYYFGSGVPDNSLHLDGDIYQDTSNGDQYKKISGVWVFQDNITGPAGSGSGASLIENVLCDSGVFVGAIVKIVADTPVDIPMEDWPTLSDVVILNLIEYTPRAENALADAYLNSNAFGVVESKPTPTTCNIRTDGATGDLFLGLDPEEEYYLSDTIPGRIVPLAARPQSPGSVVVKVGQASSDKSFLYKRGDRIIVGTSGEIGVGDGTSLNPMRLANIKRAKTGYYYKIGEDYENVVSGMQIIDGILINDGVNTIL